MSGFAPYGYRKDPADRHRFLIDEAAAETVRNIYTLYLEGVSVQKIAERLNRQQILPPTEYKRKIQKLCKPSGKKSGAEMECTNDL